MARVRMVTRTINVSEVETMAVDTTTASVETMYFTLTGDTYTPDKALKEIKKLYETDTLKIVAVKSITPTEEIYGMTEVDFLQVAKKLDKETRKLAQDEQ